MKTTHLSILIVCIASLFVALPRANSASVCGAASNLVANCGFGTGDFTGWSLSGTDVPGEFNILYGVEGIDPADGIAPHSGSTQAYVGDLVANSTTISQSMPTVIGQTYIISFYLAQDTDPALGGGTYGNTFGLSFEGNPIVNLQDVPLESYTNYRYAEIATSNMSVLSFTLGNDPGEFLLDDVSVTAAPEPAAWALIAMGSAVTFALRRKITSRT